MMRKEELEQLSPAELIRLVLELQQANAQWIASQHGSDGTPVPDDGEQVQQSPSQTVAASGAVARVDETASLQSSHHSFAHEPSLQEQLRRTSLLLQLSIEFRETLDPTVIAERMLHVIHTSLGIDHASVILVAADGSLDLAMSLFEGKIQRIMTGATRNVLERGLAGWTLRQGKSVILPDVSRDKRWVPYVEWQSNGSAMVLPIRQAHASIGVLTVFHQTPNHFTSHDMLLMEGVAAQAGVALSSARRYQDEVLRREQAFALLSMSQYLTAERSYEDLAAMLQEKSKSVFGVDFGLLFLHQERTKLTPVLVPPTLNQPVNRYVLRQATVAARNAWERKVMITETDSPHHPSRTFVAIPLIHRGMIGGVVVLVSSPSGETSFSANLWSMITTFMNVMAAACANIRLVEQLKRQTEALESLVAERTRMVEQRSTLLRVVFDSFPEGLVLLDPQEVILESNQAFNHTIIGSPHAQVVGKNFSEIWEILEQRGELTMEMKRNAHSLGQGPAPGSAGEKVMRLVVPDPTGLPRWFEIHRLAVYDEHSDDIEYYLERWVDVTNQERLQRQLLMQGQQNMLGHLASRVVHDMSVPIRHIAEHLGAGAQAIHQPELVSQCLAQAREEVAVLERTLKSLLHLYYLPDTRWECVDIVQLLRKVQQFASQHFERKGIRVHLEVGERVRPIYAQPEALRQVLLGIVFHAQEMMPNGGDITITCQWNDGEQAVDQGPYPACVINITDTGVGMSSEQIAHALDPFGAEKTPYSRGIGLYLGKQLIEQHGGRLEVTSAEGTGTLVSITLPWRGQCAHQTEHPDQPDDQHQRTTD